MDDVESVPRWILMYELEELKADIIQNHMAAGQVASGRTMKSLKVKATEDEGMLVSRPFFSVLETGRKAGKTPRRFYLIIRQWMKDKGIEAPPMPYKTNRPHKYTPEERGARSMAAAIAETIRKRGTLLHRKGGRDDIYSREVEKAMKRIKERLSRFVDSKIAHIKLNTREDIK